MGATCENEMSVTWERATGRMRDIFSVGRRLGKEGCKDPLAMEFEDGPLTVRLLQVAGVAHPQKKKDDGPLAPPKPLLVAAPQQPGQYPVLFFSHGFLLLNAHYSQLLRHVASHGFVLVAPQMYVVTGPDASQEIDDAASTINWLSTGLVEIFNAEGLSSVQPRLDMLALVGHSRGAKVAFGLSMGISKVSLDLNICAVVGLDPVDGKDVGQQTTPPVLKFSDHSFDLKIPILIVGCGLGSLKRNAFFPPCAPEGVSHEAFFSDSSEPAFHFVASEHGHMDFLDDRTDGLRGKLSYCICRNGPSRGPMRRFSGGILVAFLRAALLSDITSFEQLLKNPSIAPVKLDDPEWYAPSFPTTSNCPDLQLLFSKHSRAGRL